MSYGWGEYIFELYLSANLKNVKHLIFSNESTHKHIAPFKASSSKILHCREKKMSTKKQGSWVLQQNYIQKHKIAEILNFLSFSPSTLNLITYEIVLESDFNFSPQ